MDWLKNDIPHAVVELLHNSICSVEQLESLLLLKRNAHTQFTAEQVATNLRTSVMGADNTLQLLNLHGFVQSAGDGCYRYAGSPELDQLVEELEGLYKVRRFSVIQTIYNKP